MPTNHDSRKESGLCSDKVLWCWCGVGVVLLWCCGSGVVVLKSAETRVKEQLHARREAAAAAATWRYACVYVRTRSYSRHPHTHTHTHKHTHTHTHTVTPPRHTSASLLHSDIVSGGVGSLTQKGVVTGTYNCSTRYLINASNTCTTPPPIPFPISSSPSASHPLHTAARALSEHPASRYCRKLSLPSEPLRPQHLVLNLKSPATCGS